MISCTEYSHPLTYPRWGDYGPWRCRCGRYRGYVSRDGRATNAAEKSGPIDKRLIVSSNDGEVISFVLRNGSVEIEWCFDEALGKECESWLNGFDLRWSGFSVFQWIDAKDPALIWAIAYRLKGMGFQMRMEPDQCRE